VIAPLPEAWRVGYHVGMLNLHAPTPPAWLGRVAANLDELLIDHAHCEKKAAGVAMNLIFTYVEHADACRVLSEIVQEELEHFRLVLDLLERRGVPFRRLRPSRYGERLSLLASKEEPLRAVDRMLIAALIEARSCERFGILRDGLVDPELAAFFGSLFESEARHHSTYLRLARRFASEEVVRQRLTELARQEAEVIATGEELARMHS
jgi:tRNA-(ms[2]io[6]A)-hydroxylase